MYYKNFTYKLHVIENVKFFCNIFSKKFLTGIYGDYYGEKKTIMDVLKEDNKLPNLMQIINKKGKTYENSCS